MQIDELNRNLKSIKHELFEIRSSLITSNNSTREIELLKEKEKIRKWNDKIWR
ncbi:MAG: hypothetical protein IJ509_01650 [Bacilli bacterium]|nr:hypothetical protein [Bacilli bacterium]